MNLSDLNGKEIINIYNGERLGVIADSDILFDPHTGVLQSLVLPKQGGNFLNPFVEESQLLIPWQSVVKVGPEIIVVDLNPSEELEDF